MSVPKKTQNFKLRAARTTQNAVQSLNSILCRSAGPELQILDFLVSVPKSSHRKPQSLKLRTEATGRQNDTECCSELEQHSVSVCRPVASNSRLFGVRPKIKPQKARVFLNAQRRPEHRKFTSGKPPTPKKVRILRYFVASCG